MGWHSTNVAQQQQQAQQLPTEDLLGFTASSQQYQEGVANANQNQTTNNLGAAPAIAGIGRIEPSENVVQKNPKRKVVLVPTYSCNGGFDSKVGGDSAMVLSCAIVR